MHYKIHTFPVAEGYQAKVAPAGRSDLLVTSLGNCINNIQCNKYLLLVFILLFPSRCKTESNTVTLISACYRLMSKSPAIISLETDARSLRGRLRMKEKGKKNSL